MRRTKVVYRIILLLVIILVFVLGLMWDDMTIWYHKTAMLHVKELMADPDRAQEYSSQDEAIRQWEWHRKQLLQQGFLCRWFYDLNVTAANGAAYDKVRREMESYAGRYTDFEISRINAHKLDIVVWDISKRGLVWHKVMQSIEKQIGNEAPAAEIKSEGGLHCIDTPPELLAKFRGVWETEGGDVMYRIGRNGESSLCIEPELSKSWGDISMLSFVDDSIHFRQIVDRDGKVTGHERLTCSVVLAPSTSHPDSLGMKVYVADKMIDTLMLLRRERKRGHSTF